MEANFIDFLGQLTKSDNFRINDSCYDGIDVVSIDSKLHFDSLHAISYCDQAKTRYYLQHETISKRNN